MRLKATTADGLTRVIASTPDVDRYGDIVSASWSEEGLATYRKNPVILWGHDPQTPAIGRAENVEVVDNQLIADIRFDDSPENDLGRLVKSQFERGFLNSVSVGFQPGKSVARASLSDDDPRYATSGFVYSDSSLMEISVVNIPANPHALARRALQADLGVEKHVMSVTEGDDSWTVTFHKYDEPTGDDPAVDEETLDIEVNTPAPGPLDVFFDAEPEIIMHGEDAREVVRDIVLEIIGRPSTDTDDSVEREAPADSDACPITSIFGC
jgi:HK97 family phage prohead protease